jgi:hypothetical protein
MNDVLVKKTDLIEILKKNRDAHRGVVEKAWDGYRAMMIEQLDAQLKRARNREKVQMSVYLQTPVDHTADYDRVIGMLEMSIEENAELSEISYGRYVLDQWEWSASANLTNSMYLVK